MFTQHFTLTVEVTTKHGIGPNIAERIPPDHRQNQRQRCGKQDPICTMGAENDAGIEQKIGHFRPADAHRATQESDAAPDPPVA